MAVMTKRFKAAEALVDRSKSYSIEEAMDIVAQAPAAKFDESVDEGYVANCRAALGARWPRLWAGCSAGSHRASSRTRTVTSTSPPAGSRRWWCGGC